MTGSRTMYSHSASSLYATLFAAAFGEWEKTHPATSTEKTHDPVLLEPCTKTRHEMLPSINHAGKRDLKRSQHRPAAMAKGGAVVFAFTSLRRIANQPASLTGTVLKLAHTDASFDRANALRE